MILIGRVRFISRPHVDEGVGCGGGDGGGDGGGVGVVFLPIFSKKTLVVFLKNVQILTDFSQKRLIFRAKGVWITDWFLTPEGWGRF